MSAVTGAIKNLLNWYPRRACRREFEEQKFRRYNERPIEFAFVFRHLGALAPKSVLDVGSGTTALPHMMRNCGFLVTAIDNVRDYWPAGAYNRHWHVLDDDITATRLTKKFDLITCISVLEHIVSFDRAVKNMFALLEPGGHLILTCPYSEHAYVPNVYALPGSSYGQEASYVTQSYSRKELDRWLAESDASLVEQEFWQYWQGEFWTQGQQLIPPRASSATEAHQLSCMLLRKGG